MFHHRSVTGNVEKWYLFLFHQVPFELTRNAQIWPRTQNAGINGTADDIYLIVGDIGSKSGYGLDYILGQPFLERFYSVFDNARSRVGLARTRCTYATTNWDDPMSGYPFPNIKWYVVSKQTFVHSAARFFFCCHFVSLGMFTLPLHSWSFMSNLYKLRLGSMTSQPSLTSVFSLSLSSLLIYYKFSGSGAKVALHYC